MTSQLVDTPTAQAWMADSIDPASFDQDTFNQAVLDASQAIIDVMGWDPTLQTATELYDGLGCNMMIVNRTPIVSISSITINPGAYAVPLTNVVTNRNQVIWQCGEFPLGRANISITYDAGYAVPLPGPIVRATLATLKAMWQAPDADPNATGESFSGVMSRQFWSTGPGAVPPQAYALLSNGHWIKKILAS